MKHAMKLTALAAALAMPWAAPAFATTLDLYVDPATQTIYAQPGAGRVKLGTFRSVDAAAPATAAAPAAARTGDVATTRGGLEIKSADGNFSVKLGGRIHFDANYVLNEDDLGAADQKRNSTTDFRRARLSLSGKAYRFNYLFEQDFAGETGVGATGFREVWIGTDVLGNQQLRIGQAKPFRGMEELTSSNEITFMERPFASATGIYQRQFVQGLFLSGKFDHFGYGVSAHNNKSAGEITSGSTGPNSQALGFSGRVYAFPINSDTQTLHVGLSASRDDAGNPTAAVGSTSAAGGIELRPRLTRSGQLRTDIIGVAKAFGLQTTVAGELAYRQGPFSAQAEYALAQLSDSVNATQRDEDVETGYVQLSYFLTDHSKRYNTTRGAFGSPTVRPGAGAVELKARYDMIENKDSLQPLEVSGYTVGANYYATPNVRFMLEYNDGSRNNNAVAEQELSAVTARAQFNF